MPPNSKNLFKKRGKIFTKGGGTKPKPTKKETENRKRNREQKKQCKNKLRESIVR